MSSSIGLPGLLLLLTFSSSNPIPVALLSVQMALLLALGVN